MSPKNITAYLPKIIFTRRCSIRLHIFEAFDKLASTPEKSHAQGPILSKGNDGLNCAIELKTEQGYATNVRYHIAILNSARCRA